MNYIIQSMRLSKEKIILNLSPASCKKLGEITCFDELDSTNRWLMENVGKTDVHQHVCIAQNQSSGVGRNGKNWLSGNSKNILMSVAHQFDMPLTKMPGLSLAVGIAIVNALESLGVKQLSLKWPNDIYLNGRKLAGILIQTQSSTHTGHCAIVGIGINISIDAQDKKTINQPIAELSQQGFEVDQREQIIAAVIDELFMAFEIFSKTGLNEFFDRWNQLDHLKGQFVVLSQGDREISGHYLGINSEGAIRVALQNHQVKEYYVGELSIRPEK